MFLFLSPAQRSSEFLLDFLKVITNEIVCLALSATVTPLTPNDTYSGRTASLACKRCILYIYSTNIGTEYFKHGIHSPFFFLFKMQFVS